ncbi:alanine racemase, partial [Enterobacter hormaechei subsp. steigerwaltii]|nr:alanine racemase [Enterobacter hormaechei subsp. steigerwaltii]
AEGQIVGRWALAAADLAGCLAVAASVEGIKLRESGRPPPIVLWEGVFEASEYDAVEQYSLWPAAGNQWQLEALLSRHWKKPVKVWLKMDSGMHRTGFFPHDYASAYAALKQSEYVDSIVKFSHF